jgi:DNA-binding NarL/FixJ family response regulator
VVRVVVAEDQAAVRAGLVMILRTDPDITVVAEAADGQEAVETALRLRPDVVLMDVRMPRRDGISATRELAAAGVDVLVLTTFDLDEYVFGALRAGAAGFLLTVARGEGMIAPAVTRRLIREFAGTRPRRPEGVDPALLERLTPREREVLACIGEGLSNQQIARRLYITETTAKSHVSRILTKLGLRSRVQAAIVAREAGAG